MEHIGDNWQDVGYDNFSVLSLSSSDEDELGTGKADSALQESASKCDSISETTTLHCDDDLTSRYKGKGKDKEIATESNLELDDVGHDRCTVDLPPHRTLEDHSTARPLFEPTISECLNFDPDEHQQDDSGELHISEDVNPNELLRSLDSVCAILRDTILFVNNLTTLHHETSVKARKLCRTLAMQVDELRPIVAGYARVWRNTSSDIPLDPGLYSWLSGVRVKALALRVELQDEAWRTIQAGRSERTTNHVLEDIWRSLETWEEQMDEFLPIMQV